MSLLNRKAGSCFLSRISWSWTGTEGEVRQRGESSRGDDPIINSMARGAFYISCYPRDHGPTSIAPADLITVATEMLGSLIQWTGSCTL